MDAAPDAVAAGEVSTRRDAVRTLAAALYAGGSMALLARCAAPRAAVTVYTSADDVLAREVFAACTRATGVTVAPVFDTEATKTTGLENRLRSESDRPRADLFWSSESFAVARLAAAGVLAELPEALWGSWPEAHRDAARRWLGFAARARVVAHRSDAAPIREWTELADPALARGSRAAVAIADPRFGTTSAHLSALRVAWGAARAQGVAAPTCEEWLSALRARECLVLPGGNAATVDAVAAGECAYGLTDTDDVLAAIGRGLPLAFSLPRTLPEDNAGGGTMVVPNTIAMVSGGPGDRLAAELVAAYLVSPECEMLIARSPSRNLPLGPEVDRADRASMPFAEPDPMRFDAAEAARDGAAFSVRAHELLTRGAR